MSKRLLSDNEAETFETQYSSNVLGAKRSRRADSTQLSTPPSSQSREGSVARSDRSTTLEQEEDSDEEDDAQVQAMLFAGQAERRREKGKGKEVQVSAGVL